MKNLPRTGISPLVAIVLTLMALAAPLRLRTAASITSAGRWSALTTTCSR